MKIRSLLVITGSALLITLPLASWKYSPVNSLLILFLFFGVVQLKDTNLRMRFGFDRKLVTAFVLLICIMAIIHGTASVSKLPVFLGAVLMVVPGMILAETRERKWELPLAISAGVAALVGIGHYIGLIPPFPFEAGATLGRTFASITFGPGYTGLIKARGDYGIWLIAGSVVAARWWLLSERPRRRVVAPILIFVCGVAGLLSQSRSTWLAVAVFAFIAACVMWTGRFTGSRTRLNLIFWTGIVGAVFVLAGLAYGLWIDLGNAVVNVHPLSVLYRLKGYEIAWQGLVHQPFIGGGIQNVRVDVGAIHTKIIHNAVLYMTSAFGIGAGGLLLAVMIRPLWRGALLFMEADNPEDRIRNGLWVAAVAGTLVEMMLFAGFASKYFWFIIGIAMGELNRVPRFRSTHKQQHLIGRT